MIHETGLYLFIMDFLLCVCTYLVLTYQLSLPPPPIFARNTSENVGAHRPFAAQHRGGKFGSEQPMQLYPRWKWNLLFLSCAVT